MTWALGTHSGTIRTETDLEVLDNRNRHEAEGGADGVYGQLTPRREGHGPGERDTRLLPNNARERFLRRGGGSAVTSRHVGAGKGGGCAGAVDRTRCFLCPTFPSVALHPYA